MGMERTTLESVHHEIPDWLLQQSGEITQKATYMPSCELLALIDFFFQNEEIIFLS